jgi:hypothetical protein
MNPDARLRGDVVAERAWIPMIAAARTSHALRIES